MNNKEFQQEMIKDNTLLDGYWVYKGEELCKYYSLTHLSIEALTKSYLYASRKDQMNDLRESSFNGDREDEKIMLLHNNASARTGIISLSKEDNTFPFFSYYTGDKGFCIVFKSGVFDEGNIGIPLKVEYDDKPVKSSFVLNGFDDIYNTETQNRYRKESITSFLVKPEKWTGEDEWRILTNYVVDGEKVIEDSKKCSYNLEDIKEIRIARNMFPFYDFSSEDKNKWKNEGKVVFDLKVTHIKKEQQQSKSFYRNYDFQTELNKRIELNLKHDFLVFVLDNDIKLKWVSVAESSFEEKYIDFDFEYERKKKKLTIFNPKK